MQKLSVTQFQKFCEENGFNCYTYETDDQPLDTIDNPVRISAAYHTMRTFLAPASICFKNDGSTLRFIYVKYVLINRGSPKNHPQFSIICGDRSNDEHNSVYIVCASRVTCEKFTNNS